MRTPGCKPKKYNGPKGVKLMASETSVDMSRISNCKYCGKKLAWVKSKRTNRRYPVNWDGETVSHSGNPVVTTNDFHDCPRKRINQDD